MWLDLPLSILSPSAFDSPSVAPEESTTKRVSIERGWGGYIIFLIHSALNLHAFFWLSAPLTLVV